MMLTISGLSCLAAIIAHVSSEPLSRTKRDAVTPIKVTTIIEEPFTTLKEGSGHQGNDRFEGYVPDLLEKIFAKLHRQYTIHLVEDSKYGSEENGQWTGMIGEVIDETADLAAGPITISSKREAVVDFSRSIMSFGTIILAKKPADGESLSFSNAEDLSEQNTVRYGAVIGGQTQAFFKTSTNPIYARLWNYMETHSDDQTSSVAAGVQKVRNSNGDYAFIMESSSADFWLAKPPCDLVTVGSRLNNNNYGLATRQGDSLRNDINRILGELEVADEMTELKEKWWSVDGECSSAFSLKASVVMSVMFSTLLATLTKHLYGAMAKGATEAFFRDSQIEIYRNLWNYMESHPEDQPAGLAEGIERVRNSNGDYAFFMESSSAEYWVSKPPCDLVTVGTRLNSKQHGLVTRKGDNLKNELNDVLLELAQDGEINMLKNKWWSVDSVCNSANSFKVSFYLSLAVSIITAGYVKYL